MWNCGLTILFVTTTILTANAITTFLPTDKELIYDYKAFINSATDIPEKFASEFYLYGKLRIQSPTATSVLVQLTNVTFKLYNGERKFKYSDESKDLPIPVEAADITNPFEVILNSAGQVEGIITEKSEKLYARNMHKALAAILQLKVTDADLHPIKTGTFVTREDSIYGLGRTVYSIFDLGNELTVKKLRDTLSTKGIYQLLTKNLVGDLCEAPFEEPLSYSSQQTYNFRKENDKHILSRVISKGGFYLYPFKAKSEIYSVQARVTLNLLSVESILSPIKVEDRFIEDNLAYDIFQNGPDEKAFYDIMGGRTLNKDDLILSNLEKLLDGVSEYFKTNRIYADNIKSGQTNLANRVLDLLKTCDFEKLKEIYSELSSKTSETDKERLKMFHELLPFVGTHASVVFLKQIVHDKNLEEEVALDMIQYVPFYVPYPTESLLRDTEDMLSWGNETSKNIRKAAALCFGTLIHKTYTSEIMIATRKKQASESLSSTFIQQGSHAHASGEYLNSHPIYRKYLGTLVKKLKSTSDVEEQLLYLQVIFNTKLSIAVPYFMPIVKGEDLQNHDVREMAFWSVSHMALGDRDLWSKLYWSVLVDRNEHTEMRIAAYYLFIKSRPSLTQLMNLNQALEGETNSEVYHFHYTYLQAMSQSNDPCNQISKLNAAQILKFTQRPNQQASSRYFQIDLVDKKYGHGFEINGLHISAQRSKIIVVDVIWQMFNMRSNYYLIFFKIGGLEKQLSKSVEFNLKNGFGILDYANIWQTLSSLRNNKNFHIQISISNNYQTIQAYYFDNNNLHEFQGFWKKMFEDKFALEKKRFNINYEMFLQLIYPTELGIPASLKGLVPAMTYKDLKIQTKVENSITTLSVDGRLQGLRGIFWGLEFYNPAAAVFQGIERQHAYDTVMPLFLEIVADPAKKSLRLSWKINQDKENNVIGLKSYGRSLVYVEDSVNKGILQRSCSGCENWVHITKGEQYRYNLSLFYGNGITSGIASEVQVFDSESDIDTDSFNTLFKVPKGGHNKINTSPLVYFLTLLRSFRLTTIFQPIPGTQGFLFKLYPSNELSLTQIDLQLDIKEEITQNKDEYLPAIKFNPHLKYQLKSGDEVIKTVEADLFTETNAGHTEQKTKVNVAFASQKQKDFKVCIDSNKTWTKDGVESNILASIGESTIGECSNTIAHITVKGEQLEEQKSPFHTYEVCNKYSHNLIPDYHSLRCLAAHTSIIKYVYDIDAQQTPVEFKNLAKKLFFLLLDKYKIDYNYYDADQMDKTDKIKVSVEYTNEKLANVDIVSSQNTWELTEVPANVLLWAGLSPDNTHFSKFFLLMNYMGMVHTCTARLGEIQHEFNEEKLVEQFVVDKIWTLIIGSSEIDPLQAVFLKRLEDSTLGLKIVNKEQTLEMYPTDEINGKFKIILNGAELSQNIDNHQEEWFSYVIRPHLKSVIITILHFQLHLDYTARQLTVQIPKVSSVPLHGPCARK